MKSRHFWNWSLWNSHVEFCNIQIWHLYVSPTLTNRWTWAILFDTSRENTPFLLKISLVNIIKCWNINMADIYWICSMYQILCDLQIFTHLIFTIIFRVGVHIIPKLQERNPRQRKPELSPRSHACLLGKQLPPSGSVAQRNRAAAENL